MPADRRKTVLIVLPALKVRGGAEAVGVWMIEALKDEYNVSVLTWIADSPGNLNRVYGTSLRPGDYRILGPSPVWRFLFDRLVQSNPEHAFQKACLIYRMAQNRKDGFDILISALDEMDFGRPGIQYIHYPGLGKFYRSAGSKLRPWRLLSRFSFERMRQNVTLVNSDWTGDVVRRTYGIEPLTVFPPVAGDFPEIPWSERRDQFVCIGRFAPPKRIEMIIEMLAALRAQGYDVRLQLVGLFWDDGGRSYYETIKTLAHEHAAWVTLREGIDRAQLVQLLSQSRYGIHGAAEEPFGIAAAEMVQAGCIVFTGRVGGQAEIVGNDERLMFDGLQDGITKIRRVLDDPHEQIALRERLASKRNLFTTQAFIRRIREVVHTNATRLSR